MSSPDTDCVRTPNYNRRKHLLGPEGLITPGIAEVGSLAARLIQAIPPITVICPDKSNPLFIKRTATMAGPESPKVGAVQTLADVRRAKPGRHDFMNQARRPITVILDRVRQNYNIGALFRLCDAFLVEKLVITGTALDLRKRKLVQAARGTQHWVPWESASTAIEVVTAAKADGRQIVVVEQTSQGVPPETLFASPPACVIFGSEAKGVDPAIVAMADIAVTIPMFGMANSLNVASAAAIVLQRLSVLVPSPDRS